MSFAEYYTNMQQKTPGRKGFQHHFDLSRLGVWNCKTCASDLSLELFAIFESMTALKVKAMRNKKRRRKIFMDPCTKPEYTAKGFHFQVFHKPNEFSINSSFLRLFVWPVCHFGPLYRNETKRPKRNNKTTRATTHHEKPYKRVFSSNDLLQERMISLVCYVL